MASPAASSASRRTRRWHFLRPLSALAIHGVGKVTAEALTKAGLRTIGNLQDYRGELRALVGSHAPILRRYAMGENDRALEYDGEVKSVSAEEKWRQGAIRTDSTDDFEFNAIFHHTTSGHEKHRNNR